MCIVGNIIFFNIEIKTFYIKNLIIGTYIFFFENNIEIKTNIIYNNILIQITSLKLSLTIISYRLVFLIIVIIL